ncbi:MAG: type II toxin-antitoxin system HicB family antitoxin [Cytophagales bacterium]|jgi:predicted RNase H-like HicB family nuclease|nr:type II toxin-antitoxin system HicB family antitoxin [Cytophagales bacterium]MCA6369559.1 type II toxin-antitoxin system HicB family antitoxin [Cytophagales bacterium]MCA6370727.1 type II toxin-antitoxin system HicB family antitoxin [Cytophagales bacterium]MCA6377091.1 type II toxin-antitoxin system HicB family antitoxin [Cytophagales bacterium]MCA6383744.1 type II toxin-antitoxin system HicB family antitoxin [Cytophagales bacterium]
MKVDKKKLYHFPIFLEQDEDGVYIVSCPSFKGCHSYGKTVDEAMSNIREAIALCLEDEDPNQLNQFIGFREIEYQAV